MIDLLHFARFIKTLSAVELNRAIKVFSGLIDSELGLSNQFDNAREWLLWAEKARRANKDKRMHWYEVYLYKWGQTTKKGKKNG